jgi:hypothetical protein
MASLTTYHARTWYRICCSCIGLLFLAESVATYYYAMPFRRYYFPNIDESDAGSYVAIMLVVFVVCMVEATILQLFNRLATWFKNEG